MVVCELEAVADACNMVQVQSGEDDGWVDAMACTGTFVIRALGQTPAEPCNTAGNTAAKIMDGWKLLPLYPP